MRKFNLFKDGIIVIINFINHDNLLVKIKYQIYHHWQIYQP